MICIVHSMNRSLTRRLVKLLYFEDETSALSESMVAFSLIGDRFIFLHTNGYRGAGVYRKDR